MKGKRLLYMPLIAMLVFGMAMASAGGYVPSEEPPYTWLYLDPDPVEFFSETSLVGTEFDVSVCIYNVSRLGAVEFKLGYNTAILDAISCSLTPISTTYLRDYVPINLTTGEWDATSGIFDAEGYVFFGAVVRVLGSPFSGSGALLTITFEITAAPAEEGATVSCILDLYETEVGGIGPYPFPTWDIVHGADDGFYSYTWPVVNVWPVASFTWTPVTPVVGETVYFTSTSIDPDGTIVSWDWDFGDTTTGTGGTTSHVYTTVGSYTVTLTVEDNEGASDSAEGTIEVAEALPLVGANLVKKSAWPERHHFDVSAELGKGRDDINTLYAIVRNLNVDESTDVKVVFTIYDAADMGYLGTLEATDTLAGGEEKRLETSFDTKETTWEYTGTKMVYKVKATAEYWDGTGWVQIESPKVKWFKFTVVP